MSDLEKLLSDAEATVQHFRDWLDPDNPEGMKHVANSNRAFGADCVLDVVKAYVESKKDEYQYMVETFDHTQPSLGWRELTEWTLDLEECHREIKGCIEWDEKTKTPSYDFRIVRKPVNVDPEVIETVKGWRP